MTSDTEHCPQSIQSTISTSYVLAKNPNDSTGLTYVLARVVNVPDSNASDNESSVSPTIYPNTINVPHSYMTYNFSETPLHLCDQAALIRQHRCNNHSLPYRVIDKTRDTHTQQEIEWYADPHSNIPPPSRLVMIHKLRCYLCGDYQKTDDDIYYEGVGEHTFGYRYCTECRPYFLRSLYKGIGPIIHFRQKYEEWLNSKDDDLPTPFVWVARTRRDDKGKRIVGGNTPYRYTKWRIMNWVVQKHDFPRISQEDGESVISVEETCLTCEELSKKGTFSFEMETIIKLVPLMDLYITNLALISDSEYDPNNDDPLNKYSYKEQCEMFSRAASEYHNNDKY